MKLAQAGELGQAVSPQLQSALEAQMALRPTAVGNHTWCLAMSHVAWCTQMLSTQLLHILAS